VLNIFAFDRFFLSRKIKIFQNVKKWGVNIFVEKVKMRLVGQLDISH